MTAHKHAAMIKAKADNMDLVVLAKSAKWHEVDSEDFQFFNQHDEYFLCLPKHKEAVLNTLNGGESQVNYGEYWSEANCGSPVRWGKSWWYMSDGCESRIKPRKEKRWITYNPQSRQVFNCGKSQMPAKGFQIIEIEVEV